MVFLLLRLPWFLLIIWTVYSIMALVNYEELRKKRFINYYVFESIPQVFITLGLLGTFAGITYGLIHFDTSPTLIKESIKDLLDGLKIAFYTTLYGISASLIARKFVQYHIHKGTAVDPEFQKEELELKKINYHLANLSKNLSQSIDNAIVESLKGVVEDVNQTFKSFIDQLVSENFARLTEAIDKLVEWQTYYRGDIIQIRDAYAELVARHKEFVELAQQWVDTMNDIAGQSSQLSSIIDDFKAITDDESRFSKIIMEVKESTSNMQTVSESLIGHTDQLIEVKEAFVDTRAEVSTWLEREEGVRDSANALSHSLQELRKFEIAQIEKLDESFNNRLANTFKGLDSLMKEYISYLENRK
ncbi:MAG: MotA/TolQ/ExbB proton channel family protein [Reichenbachiella sp.]|uniref:MotA/TolQ/ExbB proton channel family protein n=1 Tax=Reichenbachiella sp. TaxID=2184521 RepID=UPI003298AD7A